MSNNSYHLEDDFDKYEKYAEQFDPSVNDRQARRKRKANVKYKPKRTKSQILSEIADTTTAEGDFTPTYQPARYEAGWLLDSIRPFYDEELITDVLARIKGGKEASVYRCQAHPGTGRSLLAVKVYRPRRFRNLRNDKLYREGRPILTSEGRVVKTTDHRIMRALGKKTEFGANVEHTSWLMYEYTTLQLLADAGGTVPQPLAASENAILMDFVGNDQITAPTLNEITLDAKLAETLFREVLRNIELMLQHRLIHGDLSAYNILFWNDKITIIDFPQVVNSRTNPEARFILERDVTRVCDYFSQQGVICNPVAIAQDFWDRYLALDPKDKAADQSRQLVDLKT